MPGFICTHHHFYSTMARGMAIPGEPASNFVEILERLWWKLDMALSDEDITLSAQIPLIECIRNGTTTVIDHHASPSMRDGSLDLIESAVRQAGIRARYVMKYQIAISPVVASRKTNASSRKLVKAMDRSQR